MEIMFFSPKNITIFTVKNVKKQNPFWTFSLKKLEIFGGFFLFWAIIFKFFERHFWSTRRNPLYLRIRKCFTCVISSFSWTFTRFDFYRFFKKWTTFTTSVKTTSIRIRDFRNIWICDPLSRFEFYQWAVWARFDTCWVIVVKNHVKSFILSRVLLYAWTGPFLFRTHSEK